MKLLNLQSNTKLAIKSPLDFLWQPSTILPILAIAESIAIILALIPGNQINHWVLFGLTSLALQWITVLSLSTIYLVRNLLKNQTVFTIAWSCLFILVINTFMFSLISWNILHLENSLLLSRWEFVGQMTLIALLIGLLSLAAFQNHWNARLQAIKSKQAQLDALHARIQPHFLFNTLNSLAVLIKKDPDQAESLLFNLVDLFRAALSDKKEVNLKTEIAVTKQYLEIEALRFGNRLKVEWELPEIIPEVLLPSLSLQPLVENAIIHGVSQIPEGGKIHISVEAKPDVVGIKICNTLTHSTSNEQTSGFKIGVNNTKERIELMSNGLNKFNTYTKDNQFIAEIILHS